MGLLALAMALRIRGGQADTCSRLSGSRFH
jgi:hypothetical protein